MHVLGTADMMLMPVAAAVAVAYDVDVSNKISVDSGYATDLIINPVVLLVTKLFVMMIFSPPMFIIYVFVSARVVSLLPKQ